MADQSNLKTQCLNLLAQGLSPEYVANTLAIDVQLVLNYSEDSTSIPSFNQTSPANQTFEFGNTLLEEDGHCSPNETLYDDLGFSQTIRGDIPSTGKETLSGSFFEHWLPEDETTQISVSKSEANSPISNWGDILGEGGMGIIRTATQNSMGREIAVKQIKPNMLRPKVLKALLQEAWITGFLEHPNIIPIYDIIHNENGHPMILMKQIVGKTWLEYIKNPKLIESENDVTKWHLSIFSQVCNAMEYSHDRGIIHLDLKPENIMIGDYGEVYVMDWGIAGSIDDRHKHWLNNVQERQYSSGSPWYMAPEMLTKNGNSLSPQSDIYLLGAILYEIVVGHPPHKAATMELIMNSITNFEPAFPENACPLLQKIILKALNHYPSNRHATIEELRLEVEDYLSLMDLNAIRNNIIQKITELENIILHKSSINKAYAQLFAAHFGIEQLKQHPKLQKDYEEQFQSATLSLINWELEMNKPDSAEMLLNYLTHKPVEIVEHIAKIQQDNSKKEHQLRKASINYSTNIGVRTRNLILLLACMGWVATPLYKILYPTPLTFTLLHTQTIVSFICLLGLGYWARHSLSSTRLNRQTYSMLLMEPLLHALGDVGAIFLGWDPVHAWILRMMVWTIQLSIYALLVEVRFTITSIISGILTILAFAKPHLIYWNTIWLNVVLVIVNYIIWKKDVQNSVDARKLDLDSIYKKRK